MTHSGDRPRILLITRNFPPLTGGMERLMLNVTRGISAWANLAVVGPKGCSAYCPEGVKVYEAPAGLAGFLVTATWKAVTACLVSRFDLILGGSGLAAPIVMLVRRLFGGNAAIFIHGLDLVVQSQVYQALFVPCIRRADLVIVNSSNTRRLAVDKGTSGERVVVIHPGTELPDLTKIESRESFCRRHDIPFEKILLFVGRMTKRKGLSQFVRNSLPAILSKEPMSGLVVVGDNPDQGLTNLGEQKQVKQAVADLQLGDHIRFLGQVTDADLISCYAHADVQVFPLVEVPGDVEGFGMVAVEAASCGTPTVAFKTGGVSDAVSPLNGSLVKPGRYDLLAEAILETLSIGLPNSATCLQHANQFRWEAYHRQLETLIRSES